jgi:hypothetical protein
VVPIRPGLTARYGDTQAMNDIHALLTGATLLTGDEAAACVAEIVARTGRRLDPARTITAEVTSDRHGTPVAWVDADGTIVLVGQDPDGPGALIQVTTRDPAEAAGLVITVDGRVVGCSPVRPVRPGDPRRAPRWPVADRDAALHGSPDREGDSS